MFIVDSFDPVDLVAPVDLIDLVAPFDLFDSYSHSLFPPKTKSPDSFLNRGSDRGR